MRLKIILWDELHESKIYEMQDFCPTLVKEQKAWNKRKLSAKNLPEGYAAPCRLKATGKNSITK